MDRESWIREQLKLTHIDTKDIPNIELYMDQVTTFMDKKLKSEKRYPDDKIMTMINNYVKNKLMPPPVKKRYSKNHLIMIVFIYYMKNFLTMADIKAITGPLMNDYYMKDSEDDISLEDIYSTIIDSFSEQSSIVADDIIKTYHQAKTLFEDENLSQQESDYLEDFSFICYLAYDIYLKKQLMEKLIDKMEEN